MVTKTIVIERKQTSWNEDSPQMDTRIINAFILSNPKARIISVIHIAAKRDRDNNNKMERLNGEIRDREKVFRGLKKMDTVVLDGMRVYYNFTKKHGGINGMTPAEASLIEVDGKNRWKTIIQNASLYKDNTV